MARQPRSSSRSHHRRSRSSAPISPPETKEQLSTVLEVVLCQTLVPRADGAGRVAAVEVMVATSAVRNLIREGKTFQIPNAIRTGSQHGMQTLDQALSALFRANMVTPDEALARCANPGEFKRALGVRSIP